jgi:hypothetical protein
MTEQISAPQYDPETPFEGILIPEAPPRERDGAFEGFSSGVALETPFLAEYWTGEDGEAVSPATAELVELLEELWDHEFDEFTLQLAREAAAAVDERLPEREEGTDPAARERFVRGWLEPLERGAQRLLETVAETVARNDAMSLSEAELDAVLAPLEVGETDLSPTFEGFLGGLLDKAKKLAKGAVKLAKKGVAAVGKFLPINILLSKLKALVRPLLERVLRYALGKLPPALRPVASRLAKRLLKLGELDETGGDEVEQPATADVRVIQQEFDLAAASLLFATDETEGELALAETAAEAQNGDGDATARLDAARERFIDEVTQGEDPEAAMENFLPAILPVARVAIGVVGRERVVGFLARYLARLIGRYVGRESSVPLARAIVDAGLRMMTLEAPPESEREAAGATLAATVEDTVHRLAELDELAFEDEDLLARETYRAFEAAAAANMPPATLRPDLRPTAHLDGTWILMPADRRVKRYKKYSRVVRTRITPHVARQLATFGGTSLEAFLFEHNGSSETVEAQAHLYEAIPGTTLDGLAVAEGGANGPERGEASIHPLTSEAAGLLLGEPGLGRDVSPEYLADPDQIAVGQRFVRLELEGAPGRPPTTRRHRSQVHVTIDLRPAREIRLHLYFSESDAQRLAAQINRGGDAATVLTAVKAAVRPGLRRALTGGIRRRVRFVAEDQLPGPRPHWLARLNAFARRLGPTIEGWLAQALASHAAFAKQFAESAAAERDGVTIIVRFQNVAGLDAVGRVVRLRVPQARTETLRLGRPERSSVEVVAGFRR